MDNKKLNFPHTIPIEVFHDNNSTTVEIFLNNELKFSKTFEPKKVHKETVTFNHLYQSGQRNQIKFVFSGLAEAQSKYLKINSLIINNQLVNIYNANYQPELNPESAKIERASLVGKTIRSEKGLVKIGRLN